MSIPRTFAKQQIKRLAGIPFFPVTDSAITEMVDALQQAISENLAANVVSAFVEESTAASRCPTAGDIRRAVLACAAAVPKMPRCNVCNSTGFVTVWKLVTYRPGTYQIAGCETLDLDAEQIDAFRKKLGKDQDILSAAKPCVCLPVEHKIYTGERT